MRTLLNLEIKGVNVKLNEHPLLQRGDGTLLTGYSVSVHARGRCIAQVKGLGYNDARELFEQIGDDQ